MHKDCRESLCKAKALTLSDSCWGHIKDKKAFRLLLEQHNACGKSMEGFYLKDLQAPSINLIHANLKGANLAHAGISGAVFSDANLSDADLCGSDISGCDFIGADCVNTNFMMADMSKARFWHANMTNADFAEASLASADFLNAVMFDSNLYHADLKDARFLTKDNFKGPGARVNVNEKGHKTARESYANLKQYFISRGRYNDVSWASYNENRMELRRLWKERRIGLLPFFIMGLLCGWGERPLRATIAALFIISVYAALYFMLKSITPSSPGEYTASLVDYLYYSTITFTTVGYGDFVPKAQALYKLLAGSEAFIGIFMMGLFVFSLGRRYSSR